MSVVPYERAWIALQSPAVELANAIAATDFVPQGLRGNPAAITAAILYGDEIGLGPMQSLAHIAVINGRPTLSAETQRAKILQEGHDLWIEESTTTRCTIAGRRKGSEQTSRITWTLDDAKRAGIGGKENWRKYPRQMLLARATAELARAVFADAIGGLAATEEADEPAEVVEVEGETAPTTRRRSRRVGINAPTTSTVPEPVQVAEAPPLPGDENPHVATAAEGPATDSGDADGPSEGVPVAGDGMTELQRPKLMALFNEHGFSGREHRLAWTTVKLGRHITSASQLTQAEASYLIDLLEAMTPTEAEA